MFFVITCKYCQNFVSFIHIIPVISISYFLVTIELLHLNDIIICDNNFRCQPKYVQYIHTFTFMYILFHSYVDPEAVVGCEDGTVRLFDMYSRKCSRIIKYVYYIFTLFFIFFVFQYFLSFV